MKNLGLLGLVFVCSASAAATGEPVAGTLTGTTSGDILDYQCARVSEEIINCDFVQIAFRKEDPVEDRETIIAALGDIDSNQIEFSEVCRTLERRDMILAGEPVPEDELTMNARKFLEDMESAETDLSSESFKALMDPMEAWATFCQSPSAETANALFDVVDKYSAQTCRPWVNRFSREFREVDENTWITESIPSGLCGIIDTSKFVADPDYPGMWSYLSSKMVTNKEGDDLLPCSELDEGEHQYLWSTPPIYNNCVFFD